MELLQEYNTYWTEVPVMLEQKIAIYSVSSPNC